MTYRFIFKSHLESLGSWFLQNCLPLPLLMFSVKVLSSSSPSALCLWSPTPAPSWSPGVLVYVRGNAWGRPRDLRASLHFCWIFSLQCSIWVASIVFFFPIARGERLYSVSQFSDYTFQPHHFLCFFERYFISVVRDCIHEVIIVIFAFMCLSRVCCNPVTGCICTIYFVVFDKPSKWTDTLPLFAWAVTLPCVLNN